MKRTMRLITMMFLLTSLGAHADVRFELTNNSTRPIWICGYVNENLFTGETYDTEKKLSPHDSFSMTIADGEVELTISSIEPRRRNGLNKYRTYQTTASANNKNKVLIWNHTKSPQKPLYPAPKTHVMGLLKTKISNNIGQKELRLSGYRNL